MGLHGISQFQANEGFIGIGEIHTNVNQKGQKKTVRKNQTVFQAPPNRLELLTWWLTATRSTN